MPSFYEIADQLHSWLNANFNPTWVLIIEMVLAGVAVIGLFAVLGLVLVIMERKVSAWMQIRLGPNRVGPKGMLQSLADTVKLIVKEGMTPSGADKFLFNLAPYIAMIVAMLLLAPIAFAGNFQLWDINVGVLYVSAISSLSVISVLMAGWASNNKYSLLGAMRSGAQIVSYELTAGLSVLAIVVLAGDLKISAIVAFAITVPVVSVSVPLIFVTFSAGALPLRILNISPTILIEPLPFEYEHHNMKMVNIIVICNFFFIAILLKPKLVIHICLKIFHSKIVFISRCNLKSIFRFHERTGSSTTKIIRIN